MSDENSNVLRFDSPEEYLIHLESTAIVPGALGSDVQSDQDNFGAGKKWCDTPTFKEAVSKARTGDRETASKITPKSYALAHSGSMNRTVYDVSGDVVDVGRYLSGEPECMSSLRRKGKPIVSVIVNCSATADFEAVQLIERGKVALEIVSGLETNGYGVEVTICNSLFGDSHSYTLTTLVKVKDSREYMNMTSLAFWLVSPSVLRRLNFRLREQQSIEAQRNIGGGYGSSRDLKPGEYDEKTSIYFPRVQNGVNYRDTIKPILEKYAID